MSELVTTSALVREEIDQQIATAKAYRRDVKASTDELRALVVMDLDTAESCAYSLPRDGKCITGPSVRLAEMAVNCWGNIRSAWRVVEIGEKWVTCEGVCHDLEKNTAHSATCKRSIWSTKGNRRYSENMIQTTIAAAGSIAYRNAVFKVIPASLIKVALLDAHQKILSEVGDYKTKLPDLKKRMAEINVSAQQLCRFFNLEDLDDMTPDQYLMTRSIYTSVINGEAFAGDYFKNAKRPQGEDSGVSIDDLQDDQSTEGG